MSFELIVGLTALAVAFVALAFALSQIDWKKRRALREAMKSDNLFGT